MTSLTETEVPGFIFDAQEKADILAVVAERGITLKELIHDAVMNDLFR